MDTESAVLKQTLLVLSYICVLSAGAEELVYVWDSSPKWKMTCPNVPAFLPKLSPFLPPHPQLLQLLPSFFYLRNSLTCFQPKLVSGCFFMTLVPVLIVFSSFTNVRACSSSFPDCPNTPQDQQERKDCFVLMFCSSIGTYFSHGSETKQNCSVWSSLGWRTPLWLQHQMEALLVLWAGPVISCQEAWC